MRLRFNEKGQTQNTWPFFRLGGLPGGDRTPDPQLRRLMLYPTELRADLKTSGDLAGPKKKLTLFTCVNFASFSNTYGRSTRIRTLDPLVPNQVRYQAAPHSATLHSIARTDSCGAQISEIYRLAYWAFPNKVSRALSPVIGLRKSAKTATPRCTAGRAARLSNQAFRYG